MTATLITAVAMGYVVLLRLNTLHGDLTDMRFRGVSKAEVMAVGSSATSTMLLTAAGGIAATLAISILLLPIGQFLGDALDRWRIGPVIVAVIAVAALAFAVVIALLFGPFSRRTQAGRADTKQP